MNSAASQPFYAKLIGSRQSPRLSPHCSPLMRQGPFPRPPLRGFVGTTSPSLICPDRPCPSRAGRRRAACQPSDIQTDFPCCAPVFSRACRHHCPGGMIGCVSRSLAQSQRPSSLLWRVSFRIRLFGACSVFTPVTARTPRFPPYRGVFFKCFRPFVASWPAPSASGRSESGRTGISPVGLVRLRQSVLARDDGACQRARAL